VRLHKDLGLTMYILDGGQEMAEILLGLVKQPALYY
jgi:hypothetical protein